MHSVSIVLRSHIGKAFNLLKSADYLEEEKKKRDGEMKTS